MTAAENKSAEAVFGKQQFMESASFSGAQKDILAALLDEKKTYTISQTKEIINHHMKREAK
jgi:hypothetical protein